MAVFNCSKNHVLRGRDTSVFGGYIAAATISHADYLVSWNFKHIVNVNRIRGYNAVNIKRGYKALEIRSPREFMRYGNEE